MVINKRFKSLFPDIRTLPMSHLPIQVRQPSSMQRRPTRTPVLRSGPEQRQCCPNDCWRCGKLCLQMQEEFQQQRHPIGKSIVAGPAGDGGRGGDCVPDTKRHTGSALCRGLSRSLMRQLQKWLWPGGPLHLLPLPCSQHSSRAVRVGLPCSAGAGAPADMADNYR